MASPTTSVARRRAGPGECAHLAALVLHRGGRIYTWRADTVTPDPVLDAWERHALDDGRSCARLLVSELIALRG
jgi:hypothetical protein